MSDQPKPTTGEWMPKRVEELLGFNAVLGCERIADAHNAALAAEREKHCRDCCCARSWKALGVHVSEINGVFIGDNTGMSIPEHIEQLREQRDEAMRLLERARYDAGDNDSMREEESLRAKVKDGKAKA